MGIALVVLALLAQAIPSRAETTSPPQSRAKAFFEIPGTDSIAVFEFESRRIIKRIPLDSAVQSRKGKLRGKATSPDGRYIYWTRHDADDLSVIDVVRYEVVERIPLNEKGPGRVTVAPDGHALYIPHYQAKALTIFDLKEKKQRVIPLNGFPGNIAVTPLGTILVTSRDSNELLAVDEATGSIHAIEVGRNPVGVAVTADGYQAYVSHDTEATVAVIDLREVPFHIAKRVKVRAAGGSAVAVGPDGKYVFVAHCCANSFLTVISIKTMSVKCEISLAPKGLDPIRFVFFPGGDEAFVINSGSMNISSFHLPCGEPISENLFD